MTIDKAADRASPEQVLAERPVTPTGRTPRFGLTVKEADWELLPIALPSPSKSPSHTMAPDMPRMTH